MAIKRNQGGGRVIFVDLKGKPINCTSPEDAGKHGALVVSNGKDQPKDVLPSNSAISGFITELDVHTGQHEGEEIHSLRVRLEDETNQEPPVVLSFSLGSFFGAKIVGLLNAADLTKPVVIAANTVRAGEKLGNGTADKDHVFPTLRQDNQRLAPTWVGVDGKATAELPAPKEVKINGKVVKDLEEVNNVVGETIKALYAKLDGVKDKPAGDDDGISADDVATAAAAERQRS